MIYLEWILKTDTQTSKHRGRVTCLKNTQCLVFQLNLGSQLQANPSICEYPLALILYNDNYSESNSYVIQEIKSEITNFKNMHPMLQYINNDYKTQMDQENNIEIAQEDAKQQHIIQIGIQVSEQPKILPLKLLKDHWLTISRPQYKRTCGISSIVSIWNHQFSRLGLGNRDPICVEQAMLKLNLIGKGSIQEGMRKKFKKAGQLTEKSENNEETLVPQVNFNDKTLHQYIDSIDFGCFTGNDTLLKWYRLLCRIYGGSGRSCYFYKTNSEKSMYKNEADAKKGLVEGLNRQNTCFIYHAHDHYFCPLGYEFIPKVQPESQTFQSSQVNEEGSELYIMVGQSSKMFPGIHVFKWSQIQLDLQTYWPKFFNIRRRKEGLQMRVGKENDIPGTTTINCIMAFEKIKD